MKYLFCTHGSYGFLGPSIAIAKRLASRGHQVAFVSEPNSNAWLGKEKLTYLPNVSHRPTGFNSRLWFDSENIILQCAYILDAAKTFKPDVLVGHQLTVGPYVVREVLGLPLAVIGLAAWMYPTRSGCGLWLLRNESDWRHREFVARVNDVRLCLGMSPIAAEPHEIPIQGDLFLLRSVPGLERNVDDLPSKVHLVGACIEPLPTPDPNLDRWLEVCEGHRCLYVQEGRTFDCKSFLNVLIGTFADTPTRVIVDFGKTDGGVPRRWPENFLAQREVCQSAVLDRAAAVVTTGHSTMVLAALCHGVPLLLLPNGSGTTDIAARCLAAGVGIVADAATITRTEMREKVEEICSNPSYREAARKLKRELAEYDSANITTNLLEELGSSRMPVLRA